MPAQRRCSNSGAIIFDLTEDEKVMKKAVQDVEKIRQENEELKNRIERLEKLLEVK